MINKLEDMLEGKGKLIYACNVGSNVLGVFIPDVKYFSTLKELADSYSSIPIVLFTVRYFVHTLLKKGDSRALDIIDSLESNSTIYMNSEFGCVLKNLKKWSCYKVR
jgi:hypothetical protein